MGKYGFCVVRREDGFRPLSGTGYKSESMARRACIEGVCGLVVRGVFKQEPHDVYMTVDGATTHWMNAIGKWVEVTK